MRASNKPGAIHAAGLIEPDLYVPQNNWIVEAKKSTARNYVRMAIGQVLDYTHLATKHGIDATPVILLPGRPEPDLQSHIGSLGITTVIRADTGFDITKPPGARRNQEGHAGAKEGPIQEIPARAETPTRVPAAVPPGDQSSRIRTLNRGDGPVRTEPPRC